MVKVPNELKDDPLASALAAELRWLMDHGLSKQNCEKTPRLCELVSPGKDEQATASSDRIAARAAHAIARALGRVKVPPAKSLTLESRRRLFMLNERDSGDLAARRIIIIKKENLSDSTLRRREFIFITALLTELGYETLGASARAEPLRKARPLGDLSGTWHALWQTTEQGIEKRNRETVAIRQRSDELEIRNAAISPDIRVGGYLWQGTMRWLPDNTLVGEYWSVDPAASAHGTLYYVVNASGQFMEGMWVGTNMDYALTTGCCVLARDEETADRCFGRLLQKDRQIYLKQTEV